jgi:hypothetical protein
MRTALLAVAVLATAVILTALLFAYWPEAARFLMDAPAPAV